METAAITSFLFMGLALGLIHAFDPDHLAAVSGLSAGDVNTSERASSLLGNFRFAIQWSVGHGSALLIIALFVFVAGSAIPAELSAFAEHSVAFMLIAIGLLAFWRLKTNREHLASGVSAPIVGLIHGTAGSAPLLALIPVSQITQPAVGIVYVLFFSAGVVLAMAGFGGVIAHSMRMVKRSYHALHAVLQGFMAAFSLLLGLYLAFSSL